VRLLLMSITMASNLTALPKGPAFDCGDAQVRAQGRHLATVVTIRGAIDAVNVDPISEYTRRLILAEKPIVLDLSGVNSFAAGAISLLDGLDEDSCAAGLGWTLIPSDSVTEQLRDHDAEPVFPVARSVHEALNQFADVILRRRQLLLPLVAKTA
jgi:anti-anti-sigma regulatory factor